MAELDYVRASHIQEAVLMLNHPGIRSRVLAGSTDLALLLRADANLCDRVVDVSLIPELHSIYREEDRVMIGAAATFNEVISNPIVIETAPVLVQACRQVGAVQIRNMGTLGGNVCNAAACADSLPALVCLNTRARIFSPAGERVMGIEELVVKPNQTLLKPGDLLVSLFYQVPLPGSRSIFLKLGRRNAMAISRLTVAVLGRLDSAGQIAEVRIVPGAATPQILRLKAAEDSMLGQAPSQELYETTARLVVNEMVKLAGRRWSFEFKEPVLMAMTSRALAQVFNDPLSSSIEE